MRELHRAMARALSFCSGRSEFHLEELLHRLAWEVRHSVDGGFSAVALVFRDSGGRVIVGRSEGRGTLPEEVLHTMLAEAGDVGVPCRVRDHALDAVRFIDPRFRTSLIATISTPTIVLPLTQGIVWFGLEGVASKEAVSQGEEIASEISQWFEWYGPIVRDLLDRGARDRSLKASAFRLTALLHDIRAPLGIIRHLVPRSPQSSMESELDSEHLHRELDYLDRLLALAAPHRSALRSDSADVGSVVARVVHRFRREGGGCEVIFERPYEEARALIGEVDLERVITNLVGNAVQHSRGTTVVVGASLDNDTVRLWVRDNGVGLNEGERAAPRSGWGVGREICEETVRACGGEISVSTRRGEGTEVSIALKRAASLEKTLDRSARVADIPPHYGASLEGIFIVDDDEEQARSLQRVLRARGVDSAYLPSVDQLFCDDGLRDGSIVVCDVHMPTGGVERLLKELKRVGREVKVGVVSGDLTDESLYHLAALGAKAAFVKPVDVEELCRWIEQERRPAMSERRVA